MAIIQARSKRKSGGGRYRFTLAKRKHMTGNVPTMTKLGDEKKKSTRTKGGGEKQRLLQANKANLTDPKTKQTSTVAITGVEENPANRYYARRNIITKGTIIETPKGKARVTSRPGQEGIVNAVLV